MALKATSAVFAIDKIILLIEKISLIIKELNKIVEINISNLGPKNKARMI